MIIKFERSYSVGEVENLTLNHHGIYIWFLKRAFREKLPIDFPNELLIALRQEEYYMLYIGVGPENADLSSTLASRLVGSHIKGNIYGSTFRYSMSALLNLQFFYKDKIDKKGKRKRAYYLSKEDETKLSNFLNENCDLCMVNYNNPWTIEESLIAYYSPLLNLEYNKGGWHYRKMKNIRKLSRINSMPLTV